VCASSRSARRAGRSVKVIARCQDAGVNPGFALGASTTSTPTAARGRHRAALEADIDRLADVLGAAVAAERQTAGATA
jgi:glycine dehydrogenase subunit 1